MIEEAFRRARYLGLRRCPALRCGVHREIARTFVHECLQAALYSKVASWRGKSGQHPFARRGNLDRLWWWPVGIHCCHRGCLPSLPAASATRDRLAGAGAPLSRSAAEQSPSLLVGNGGARGERRERRGRSGWRSVLGPSSRASLDGRNLETASRTAGFAWPWLRRNNEEGRGRVRRNRSWTIRRNPTRGRGRPTQVGARLTCR
jgi:hypothetical protein